MSRKEYYWDKKTKSFVEIKPANQVEIHNIITDEIDPIQSHATEEGKVFTSKSALKRHYKEHGFEMTGGDHLTGETPKPYKADPNEIREAAEKAYYDIKYDKIPISEKERELCRQEQRAYENWKQRNR